MGLCLIEGQLILRCTREYQTGLLPANILKGWTMFPASVEYMTGMLGIILTLFALSLWWMDGRHGLNRFPIVIAFTRTMSHYSLSIYVMHHIMHIWPLWIYGLLMGQEPTYYWTTALSWPIALGLVIPCMTLLYLLFRSVESGRRFSLESLMRRVCDEKSENTEVVRQANL